jgi:hypothetical protein
LRKFYLSIQHNNPYVHEYDNNFHEYGSELVSVRQSDKERQASPTAQEVTTGKVHGLNLLLCMEIIKSAETRKE